MATTRVIVEYIICFPQDYVPWLELCQSDNTVTDSYM